MDEGSSAGIRALAAAPVAAGAISGWQQRRRRQGAGPSRGTHADRNVPNSHGRSPSGCGSQHKEKGMDT
jgi:hypothetical protein